jgi:hypothetical protein
MESAASSDLPGGMPTGFSSRAAISRMVAGTLTLAGNGTAAFRPILKAAL